MFLSEEVSTIKQATFVLSNKRLLCKAKIEGPV